VWCVAGPEPHAVSPSVDWWAQPPDHLSVTFTYLHICECALIYPRATWTLSSRAPDFVMGVLIGINVLPIYTAIT